MRLKALILFCLLVMFSIAATPTSPEQLEKKLSKAQEEFAIAEKMFDPYYTGPLLAPGVTIPAPGHVAIQPYLFYVGTYGRYNDSGGSENVPTTYTLDGIGIAFVGFTEWVGLQVLAGYETNKQSGNRGSGWIDPSLTLLFPIVKETPTIPGMLVAVRETFPAGRYQHLNPNKGGVDATGSGAYRTSFFFNIAKIFWQLPLHPMRARLATQYDLPAHVNVNDFNAYGGGFETDARVRRPFGFSADFAYEYSFTQKWVAALDILYTYNAKTTFSGFPGVSCDCVCASLGGPSGQQLSLAPAIEYNISDSAGIVAGPWFTVWGKNSSQFAAGVFSFYIAW